MASVWPRTGSTNTWRSACHRRLRINIRQHQPVEIATLRHVIVGIGLVEQAAVVPHEEVARPPPVTVFVLGLRRMGKQAVEQRQRIRVRHADDPFDTYRIEVEHLPPRFRVDTDKSVNNAVFNLVAALLGHPPGVMPAQTVIQGNLLDSGSNCSGRLPARA